MVYDHFFQFPYNADRTPPTFKQVSPDAASHVDGVDFSSMTFSENVAETTAAVWAVDLNLGFSRPAPDGTTSTSGCEPADFSGFPAGAIALTRRGGCNFAVKSSLAKAAGAVATIVMNEGNNDTPGRSGPTAGTLGSPNQGVALGTSYPIGLDLANGKSTGDTGSVATVRIDRVNETRTTRNIIAETPNGDPDNVVVVGAHLDSVPRGAGINDNGSGSAGILEIAEEIGDRHFESVTNKVRFMWYSAEEFGLLGSRAYVNSLPAAERDRITAMLNFDMIGSPNYVRFVYDGDNSEYPAAKDALGNVVVGEGPPGSGELERIFHDYFTGVGLTSGETPFSGRSDYGPFIAEGVGIPAGGLFTGAEGAKTAGQATVYGGEAGVAYDKCYHLACDTFSNVNLKGLDEMVDAAAHAAYSLSRRDFGERPLVDPAGDVSGTDGVTGSGGGLHADHDHAGDES